MVMKELILTVSTFGRCGVLKELILTFSIVGGVVVLKELFLTVSILGGCGGLERTDFNSFYLWKVWQS